MTDIFELFRSIEKKEPAGQPEFLIAGLGNPGREYVFTRHNAGFLALDYAAQRCGVSLDRAKFHALFGRATLGGHNVILLKPQTMMNASGIAIRECAAYFNIPTDHIIVVSDDINLPVGRLRLRMSGSDGGQKGLRSTIEQLNSDAFPRIRVGVGAPPSRDYELADWVLGKFPECDRETLFRLFGVVYETLELLVGGDREAAVRHCNSGGAPSGGHK